MTERNFEKELQYWTYNDPEYGEDSEHISYPALIGLLEEMYGKIKELEQRQDRRDKYTLM